MGRAGGGGGGHSHSGGGHSAGRTGGGHSMGSRSGFSGSSGSRARGGGSSGAGGFGGPGRGTMGGGPRGPMGGPRGPHMTPPPPHMAPPPPRYGYARPRRLFPRLAGIILVWVIIFIIAMAEAVSSRSGNSGTGSTGQQTITHEREKLDSGVGYRNDCIIDELGWFDNISRTESQLQDFYDATGVQPYVYLVDYDTYKDEAQTDDEKYAWAEDYYDNNFTEENIFLYVYFAEENTDEDVGYMCYINGYQVSTVMDSEAVEIFWNNLDYYWYSNYSTDDVFIKTFNDTASTIMAEVESKYDAQKARTRLWIILVLVIAVIIILIISFKWWKKKAQRKKEEAEETERILNTPMQDLVNDNLKDLENKYK